MSRVYGRVQVKNTEKAYVGDILFEPRQLTYIVDNVMYANWTYREELDEDGCFSVDVLPGEYFVHLHDATLEITVPAINEITLKEMLKTRYRT